MYPLKEELFEIPYSEMQVYDALSELSDTFYVFHSVRWIKKTKKWPSTWKENDFLILNKKIGGLVVEVKGGDIEYNNGMFYQINTQSNEVTELDPVKKKDPLSQAIDGAYHYRGILGSVREKTNTKLALDDRFPIEVAVWFSSCEINEEKMKKFPLAYREIVPAVLDFNDLKRPSEAIRKVYDFYDSYSKVDISDEEFNEIIEAIASDFELITAPSVQKAKLDKAFLKLTNEQMGLLDYISEQDKATIQGVAGTGKTLIAKEAARRFGMEDRKVLFLCYNRFLYLDLLKRYPYSNVKYLNIHSFINEYGNYDGKDLSQVDSRVEALYDIDFSELGFDDIIIDEGQDLDNMEVLYFKDCVPEGHFFVFYDKNQAVINDVVPDWISGSECRLVLTRNCRNTYEIALTAYNVIDVELNQKMQMLNGAQTTISYIKGDPTSRLTKIIQMLTGDKYGYEYSEITILSLKTENTSVFKDVKKVAGIPITNEKTNSSVLFTTAKKFKGLESRAVIIVDIDEECFGNDRKKRDFYVACSRATQYLTLIVNGDDNKIKDIANVIGGSKQFAPKGIIAMKTKSKELKL